jgi:hypothetical protein
MVIERLREDPAIKLELSAQRTLVESWNATQDALLALEPDRCDKLSAIEVAVMCGLADRQMVTLLTKEFRPKHKSPRDFRQIQPRIKKGSEGGYRGPVWIYRRRPIEIWWEDYENSRSGKRGEAARARWAEAMRRRSKSDDLDKRLADREVKRLEALIENHAEKQRALQAQLQAARAAAGIAAMVDIRAWMQQATRSLAGAMSDRQSFIVDENGDVLDHATLPVSTADEISEQLANGAQVDTLTLDQALHRPWAVMARWDLWRGVWQCVIDEAAVGLADASTALSQHRADVVQARTGGLDREGPTRVRERP